MRWRRRFALVVLSAVLAACSRSADTHRYQLTGTVAGFEPSPARVDRWTLATGTPAQIEEMARFFGVTARAEGGLVTHTLSTAVIGHDGRIMRLFPSNSWHPDELYDAVRLGVERSARR